MKQVILSLKNSGKSRDVESVSLPESVGQGGITTLYSASGLRLFIFDYRLQQPTIVKTVNPRRCHGFGFCLTGNIESQPSCLKESFMIKAGQSGFFSFPEMDSFVETVGSKRFVRISIQMDPDVMPALVGKDPEKLPPALTVDEGSAYREVNRITPAMRTTLYQMLHCSYQGFGRRLFLEGKVLELIAHKIVQLGADNQCTKREKHLTAGEIECIRHAANLLIKDFEHPPTIATLSETIGMCRSKFFDSFQAVFGITPFEYLHRRRMETAVHLIREGEIHVTQAAYAVGYSSPSHFTKAFKKHFGVTPSQCPKTPLLCNV